MADPSRSEADERDDARHEDRGKEQAEGEGRRGAHARTLPATEFHGNRHRIRFAAVGEDHLVALTDAEFA
ncbi:MAG: hypothetical protein ACPHJ1_10155, partial [Ilumatobacteraceae bacterium]